ncbi:hypothetical protein [Lysobacter gummosus]|uniref:hypothetical protein n=1 Tax=Lysobacter gummosus TaxID=262324 RepID=UPI00363DAA4A
MRDRSYAVPTPERLQEQRKLRPHPVPMRQPHACLNARRTAPGRERRRRPVVAVFARPQLRRSYPRALQEQRKLRPRPTCQRESQLKPIQPNSAKPRTHRRRAPTGTFPLAANPNRDPHRPLAS